MKQNIFNPEQKKYLRTQLLRFKNFTALSWFDISCDIYDIHTGDLDHDLDYNNIDLPVKKEALRRFASGEEATKASSIKIIYDYLVYHEMIDQGFFTKLNDKFYDVAHYFSERYPLDKKTYKPIYEDLNGFYEYFDDDKKHFIIAIDWHSEEKFLRIQGHGYNSSTNECWQISGWLTLPSKSQISIFIKGLKPSFETYSICKEANHNSNLIFEQFFIHGKNKGLKFNRIESKDYDFYCNKYFKYDNSYIEQFGFRSVAIDQKQSSSRRINNYINLVKKNKNDKNHISLTKGFYDLSNNTLGEDFLEAVWYGDEKRIDNYISNGGNVNYADHTGGRALHIAAEDFSGGKLKRLTKYHDQINYLVKDGEGRLPSEVACSQQYVNEHLADELIRREREQAEKLGLDYKVISQRNDNTIDSLPDNKSDTLEL
jgi:hypothetical protein